MAIVGRDGRRRSRAAQIAALSSTSGSASASTPSTSSLPCSSRTPAPTVRPSAWLPVAVRRSGDGGTVDVEGRVHGQHHVGRPGEEVVGA